MKYNLLKLFAAYAAFSNPAFAAFHEDSVVSTDEGPVQISKLRLGARVKAYSTISTAMGKADITYKGISHNLTRSCIDIDIGTRIIRAMPDQLFFDISSNFWVKARDLEAEDHVLIGEDGSPINILDVQLRRRHVLKFPIELSINSPGRALFVDGVLCHNMDDALGYLGKQAIADGLKRTVFAAVPPPVLVGVGGALMVTAHAAKQINQPGHEMVKDSFSDYDQHELPPSLRDAGIEFPAVEVRPAAAPRPVEDADTKRREKQEKLERFRQANRANKKHVHVVDPGASTGLPRSLVQVPSYQDPNWFEHHDWKKHPIVNMGAFQMRQGGYRSPEEIAAEKKASFVLTEAEARQQADKREADKQQKEGRAAAIKASGAKTEQERIAAVKSYDDWAKSLADAPAPVIPKATPQEEEALKKMVPKEDNLASMFRFAMGYQHVHPQQAAAADAPRSFPMNQEIIAMPPNIGIHVLTKAGYEAQNRVLNRMRERHEDNKRQLEEQHRIEQQEGIEAAKRSEGNHKRVSSEKARAFQKDIEKEHVLLRDRLNAQRQLRRKK